MLRTETAEDLSVIQWFMRQQHDADVLRAPYLEDQETLISFYMNYRNQPLPQGLEWMSGELLPDTYLLAESIMPQIANSVFGGKSVTVNAYTLAGTEVNKALDKALYRLRRQSDFEFRAIPSMRMATITGQAFQENIWVSQWGEKRIPIFSNPQVNAYGEQVAPPKIIDHETRAHKVFDGPMTFYPDNEKIWRSAATDLMGNPLVWMKELSLDLDYMEMVNRDYKSEYGSDFYRNLDLLHHTHRTQLAREDQYTGNAGFPMHGRERSATEQVSFAGRGTLEGSNSIAMFHAYAEVPKHIRDYSRRDESQKRLVMFTPDGVLLRDVEMPTYNRMAPFRDIKFMQVANEPFGRSPLWWCLPEIEQRSELRNLRQAEAWLNIFQTRVANRNAGFDQNDFINKPGAVWFFDHDTMRAQDTIMTLPRQPVLPEIYREDALMEDHINRTFGSTPNMQGEGLGARATAHEAQLVDVRAGGRADLISRQLAHQYELQAARDYLGMFAAFSEKPLEVQVDGEEASFPVEIFAEDFDFEYDVEINAGEYGVMNSQSLQALNQVLGMAFQTPEALMELDPRLAMSSYQHRTGMDNVLRPRAEVENERAAMQMQAMMAQQAEAAGQQGRAPANA